MPCSTVRNATTGTPPIARRLSLTSIRRSTRPSGRRTSADVGVAPAATTGPATPSSSSAAMALGASSTREAELTGIGGALEDADAPSGPFERQAGGQTADARTDDERRTRARHAGDYAAPTSTKRTNLHRQSAPTSTDSPLRSLHDGPRRVRGDSASPNAAERLQPLVPSGLAGARGAEGAAEADGGREGRHPASSSAARRSGPARSNRR